jgi:hypothetical protein
MNIFTGYQIDGLSNKKSMNESWLPRLHRTMHGPRRPVSLLIRRYWRKYMLHHRRHGMIMYHLHMMHGMRLYRQRWTPGVRTCRARIPARGRIFFPMRE